MSIEDVIDAAQNTRLLLFGLFKVMSASCQRRIRNMRMRELGKAQENLKHNLSFSEVESLKWHEVFLAGTRRSG